MCLSVCVLNVPDLKPRCQYYFLPTKQPEFLTLFVQIVHVSFLAYRLTYPHHWLIGAIQFNDVYISDCLEATGYVRIPVPFGPNWSYKINCLHWSLIEFTRQRGLGARCTRCALFTAPDDPLKHGSDVDNCLCTSVYTRHWLDSLQLSWWALSEANQTSWSIQTLIFRIL